MKKASCKPLGKPDHSTTRVVPLVLKPLICQGDGDSRATILRNGKKVHQ